MVLGELIPVGGDGEPIRLTSPVLLVGRREDCDVVLRFSSISGRHAELRIIDGYWYVVDKNSKNGVRVNRVRVDERRLDPGDIVAFAKEKYEIKYDPVELGALGPRPPEIIRTEVFDRPLMERNSIDTPEDSGISLGS